MKGNAVTWIIIAVVVIVIAVAGYFGVKALSATGSKDTSTGTGGGFNPFKKSTGKDSSGSSSDSSSDDDGSAEGESAEIALYDGYAQGLYEAMWGPGTNSDKIYNVFRKISTLEELEKLLAAYKKKRNVEFTEDLKDEWLWGKDTLKGINKILKENNIDTTLNF